MRMVARLLLVIPIAIIMAVGASGLFLSIATVVSPDMGAMLAGAVGALGDAIFGLALDGVDPTPAAASATWAGFRFAIAILVAPALLTAIVSELMRWNGAITQMTLAGFVAALLPLALLGLNRVPSGPEARVLAALFLTGVVAGWIYWAIAGRGAADDPRQPSAPPPASSGS